MRKTNLRKNKGITLIALVITIIVLLILAGVAISMLSGENGILRKAAEAKTKTEDGQKQEETALISMELETHFQTENKKYKCSSGFITGIEIGVTTAQDLKDALGSDEYKIMAKDEQNELEPTDKVTTGVAVQKNGKTIARVVVFGDVNGDNSFDATDLLSVQYLLNNTKNYEDYEIAAMDANHDGYIRMASDEEEEKDDVKRIAHYADDPIEQNYYASSPKTLKILDIRPIEERYIKTLSNDFTQKFKIELDKTTNQYVVNGVTTSTLSEEITDILPNSKIKRTKPNRELNRGETIPAGSTLVISIEEENGFTELNFGINVAD